MATDIEAGRHLTYHAAWLKERGEPFTKEAAMAKLFCSELATRATGGDPYLIRDGLSLDARRDLVVEVTMTTSVGGSGQLFWAGPAGGYAEARSSRFTVEGDGERVYRVPLPAQGGNVTSLRLDPLTGPGDIAIESIRVFG
jgi:hypothetical protein